MQFTHPGKAETSTSNYLCPLTCIAANGVGNFCSGRFWKTYHFPKYQVGGILQITEKAVVTTKPTNGNTCISVKPQKPCTTPCHEYILMLAQIPPRMILLHSHGLFHSNDQSQTASSTGRDAVPNPSSSLIVAPFSKSSFWQELPALDRWEFNSRKPSTFQYNLCIRKLTLLP